VGIHPSRYCMPTRPLPENTPHPLTNIHYLQPSEPKTGLH
jgi:hypothetical protein